MADTQDNPPLELLRCLFILDADSGVLIRRITRAPNARAGDKVGSLDGRGYLHVNISGRFYRVHRLVYAMYHSGPPPRVIDHVDGDRLNNRPSNLRPANERQNVGNSKMFSNNTSGYRGVYLHSRRRKWCAQIKIKGETKYLGWYDTPEDAKSAYDKAASDHFGEFYRRP